MPRTLYVRQLNDVIHDKLNDLSQKQGVTVGSIIEEAVGDWMKQKHDIPSKHHLILYSFLHKFLIDEFNKTVLPD